MRNKKLVILTMAACMTAGLAARMRRKERRYRNNSSDCGREHCRRDCGEQCRGDESSWRFHRR